MPTDLRSDSDILPESVGSIFYLIGTGSLSDDNFLEPTALDKGGKWHTCPMRRAERVHAFPLTRLLKKRGEYLCMLFFG